MLLNNPAPTVPAPRAMVLPRKERRLINRFRGFVQLSSRGSFSSVLEPFAVESIDVFTPVESPRFALHAAREKLRTGYRARSDSRLRKENGTYGIRIRNERMTVESSIVSQFQADSSTSLEILLVLVHFDHVASVILDADHSVMCSAVKSRAPNGVIHFGLPEPTEWQRIGNQILPASIFARSHFVSMRRPPRMVRLFRAQSHGTGFCNQYRGRRHVSRNRLYSCA